MSAATAGAAAASSISNSSASLSLDTNGKPNTRRRTMVVVEKRLTNDGLTEGVNGVLNGKDLSHTIKGESVVERMKDYSKLKKGLITSSNVSPRHRRDAPKPVKPKWQTVLSVLTKNCLLLTSLLWLGQTIWKWTYNTRDNVNSPFVALEYESRISEVETSLKKTAKMLQVQLDAIDKKIGSEIGMATKEFIKRIESQGTLFDDGFKKLESITDSLEKSLGELKELGLISREEFEKHVDELQNSKSVDDRSRNLDLDQIRVFAVNVVQEEIEKHAADGLGRVDYALASGGAKIVRHSTPYGFKKGTNSHKMLTPSFGEPGQCFSLQGSSGFVEIRLRTGIIPEAITLEHVAKSVAYDRSTAPRDCRVSAWFESPKDGLSSNPNQVVTLTEFSYDLEKSNAQTFDVKASNSGIINMVRFDFTSNHGNLAHTCIYRFRVHGYEPGSPSAMGL
ncbi:SUN domain-containing protein 1-like [Zingiber officinale]|uniref:SUN domain-containing protein n=1 Tax=Zingiber officinale TaxID=94328 RepID=A0A8J5LTF0_ZINOF|nr:SUN domain-containing protein 1-like [Zingiber officinale]XP_042470970.1 SUN domain-containing protein 1-like [Zingiber officinale]KAG6522720.1 hypothetical protein ZIOFF_019871 [Zingiber officinale]